MSRFVLTAQLQLQAPRNVRQVANQIQRQLGSVSVDLNIQNGRQATQQLGQINQQVNNLNKTSDKLGKTFAVSVRRFAAFSIVSRGIGLFTNKLSTAVEESIDFQRELIKIKQVSGATEQALTNLSSTITRLSTDLGTSSKDLLATSRILAQTGLAAAQLETALTALAKTTLAPTFENIEKTAEGAVAILSQFGQGVGALETQLGAINAVAGQFAVESGDLISAVRRTGGVFKAAGGELNDLLALFTSVRATTRESSESIATGLRTIFTRIQRPATIEFMKQFGVELVDLEGKFIGPFEAVRQLSTALKGLEEGDIRFVQIAEELGGFRQIGKVIPLIQQFEVAERARQAAIAGASSLEKDATTAQEALAVQIEKTRQNFLALIRSISETTSFSVLVKTTLGLADALIKVADALKPIVPLMAAFAGIKIAKGLGSFAGALRGGITTRNAGGPIGFATGGVVPGTGNRDTVPAMLTPGEFVIRKSSVNKIGAGTLAAMNENRYNDGGTVVSAKATSLAKEYVKRQQETFYKGSGSPFMIEPSAGRFANKFNPDDTFQFTLDRQNVDIDSPEFASDRRRFSKTYSQYKKTNNARIRGILFEKFLRQSGIIEGAQTASGSSATSSRLDGTFRGIPAEVKSTKQAVSNTDIGKKVVGGAINPRSLVDNELADILTTKTLNANNNILDFGNIVLLQDVREGLGKFFGGNIPKYATGGPAPSDTVPALLTPGEFVINKGAASRIGRANLDTMNKKGVAGFATGGAVGHVQRFAKGGGVDPATALLLAPTIIDSFASSINSTEENLSDLATTSVSVGKSFSQLSSLALQLGVVMQLSGRNFSDLGSLVKKVAKGDIGTKFAKKITGRARAERLAELKSGREQTLKIRNSNLSKGTGSEREFASLFGPRGANSRKLRSGRIGGSLKGILGSGGGLTKTIGAIARIAGPVGIAGAAIAGLNSVVGAGLNLQEKYNDAIKQGNVERIKELGVLKEAPALFAIFGKDAAKAGVNLLSYFGGNTLKYVELNAEAQALAARATKEFEENAKEQNKAMRDLTSGTRKATEVFKSGELTKNLKNTIEQGAAEIAAANAKVANDLNRVAGPLKDWIAKNFGIGSTDQEIADKSIQNAREVEKNAIQATSKRISELDDSIREWNRQTILSGDTFESVMQTLETEVGGFKGTLSIEEAEKLSQAYINQYKNIISSLKIAQALNSSLSILDSNVKALNISFADNLSIINGEFNQFSSSLSALEAVTQGAAINSEDLTKNLDSVSSELKKFGASPKIINETTSKFRDLNKVSSVLPQVLSDIKADPNFTGKSSDFTRELGERLADQIGDGAIADVLKDSSGKLFEGIDFSDLGADVSVQISQIMERLASGAQVDLGVLQELENAYKNQAKIVKAVYETEKKLLDAKLAAIDVERNSAQVLEEFGIKSFTTAQRMELLQRKITEGVGKDVSTDGKSLELAIDGISDELTRKQRELAGSTNAQENARLGVEIEKLRDRLTKANDAISEEIDVKRESLRLAKERLKLDREAVDALLAGDIETFLQKDEASGAKQALLSGNQAALQNFDQRAIGEALKSISDVDDKRKAAESAVQAGVISQSMADVLTEDTPEIKEIREDVKALAGAQRAGAEAQVASAETDVSIANEQRIKSDEKFAVAVNTFAEAVRLNDETNTKIQERTSKLESELPGIETREKEKIEKVRAENQEKEAKLAIEASDRGIALNPDGEYTKNANQVGGHESLMEGKSDTQKMLERTTQKAAVKKGDEDPLAPITNYYKDLFEGRSTLFGGVRRKDENILGFNTGGSVPIYASRGRSIFKPRGTDTVPAMLTPGEYVVNKKGVERGDNKSILSAMNRGATFTNGVYNNEGGGGSMGIDTTALQNIASTLSTSFNKFNETVNRLINFKFEMTIAPTRVDVVINTPQAMQQMGVAAKEEILNAVVSEISINQLGKLRRGRNA